MTGSVFRLLGSLNPLYKTLNQSNETLIFQHFGLLTETLFWKTNDYN